MTESKEDFVKRALERVAITLEVTEEDNRTPEECIMDTTHDLLDGLDDVYLAPGNKLDEADIVEAGLIYEEIEHEKCKKWGEWMENVIFFARANSSHRIVKETEFLYDWIDRTRYQYLKLIQYHIDNPTVIE
jgi:hypothetical protein